MGKVPSNPNPGNKPEGDDPLSALISGNVDALLAEAESLASDVARQLGSEPAGASATSAAEAGGERPERTDASGPDAAEAVLAEMEALAASLREPSAAGEAAPPETGAGVAPKRDEPNAPVASPSSAGVKDVPTQTSGGDPTALAKELDAEIAAAADLAEGLAPSARAVAPAPGRVEEVSVPASASPAGRVRGRIRVPGFVRAAPRAALRAPAWAIVGICRLVDWPFGWMSPSLKEKLGYIGMVTAIMAAVAWAVGALGPGR